MTITFSAVCSDTVPGCPGRFTTETKKELLKHVEIHSQTAHPGLVITDEQVEALIKQAI